MLIYHLTSPANLSTHSQADQKPVKRAKESYQEPQQAPSHSNITETAKLVATCTAAATAALLQQHHASNHMVRS